MAICVHLEMHWYSKCIFEKMQFDIQWSSKWYSKFWMNELMILAILGASRDALIFEMHFDIQWYSTWYSKFWMNEWYWPFSVHLEMRWYSKWYSKCIQTRCTDIQKHFWMNDIQHAFLNEWYNDIQNFECKGMDRNDIPKKKFKLYAREWIEMIFKKFVQNVCMIEMSFKKFI